MKNVAIVIIFEPLFIALRPLIDVQYVPVRCMATASRNSFTLALVNVLTGPDTPALFTIISTPPNFFRIFSNIELIPASSATSTPGKTPNLPEEPEEATISSKMPAVWSSGSFLLPMMIILAPFSANFLAIACPIPVPLPVITTVLSVNFKLDLEDTCFSTKLPLSYYY